MVVTTLSGAAERLAAALNSAVRADGELQLQEKLVGGLDVAVPRAPELPADLAELRRPEGEGGGEAAVARARRDLGEGRRLVGGVDAHAGEPALRQLVVERGVEAAQGAVEVVALVGDPFEAGDEAAVRALLQRLPAVGDVEAAEPAVAIGDRAARPARAHFNVRILRDVLEGLEVRVPGDVARVLPLEHALDVAGVDLAGRFDEGEGVGEGFRD